jgi:hypothetical protein
MGAAKPVVLFKARCCFSSQNGSVKSSAEGTDEAVEGDEGEEVVCGEGNACPARQEATVVVDGEGEPRLLLLLLLLLLLPAILLLSSWCCGLVQNGMARWWCTGSPVHHPNGFHTILPYDFDFTILMVICGHFGVFVKS